MPCLRQFASLLLFMGLSQPLAAQPQFTDVTASSGIDYVHGFQLGNHDSMTGGAAARDYDGDGWTDLIVTRFNDPPILYRNLGNGSFEDVTASSGIDLSMSELNGAAWGDINNDGHPDLYLTSVKQGQTNQLYMNQGDGTFLEQATQRAAEVGGGSTYRHGTSVAFGDYDGDGWLDIHTNEWGTRDVAAGQVRSHARLLRNRGASQPGHFTDTTLAAGVSLDQLYGEGPLADPGVGAWSFSSRFTDLDRDGHPDLVTAGDFGTSRVFWNNGNGTFVDGTDSASFGTDENGMGLTVGDANADGLFDVFITSIYHHEPPLQGHNQGGNYGTSGNRLYQNTGQRTFVDVTDAAGVRDGDWGWGTSFVDYDNDGDLDLTMTNGFLGPSSDFFDDAMRLWENQGDGTFADVSLSAGITDTGLGKGLVTFDFDNDGDLDIFVVNNEAQPVLYRNDGGNQNQWLKLSLEGTRSNRDGIGAIITLERTKGQPPLVRELDGGSNYLSQNDLLAHFGLGESTDPIERITIEWSDGSTQVLRDVAVNQHLHVVQSGKRTPPATPLLGGTLLPVPEPSGTAAWAGLAGLWAARRLRRASTSSRLVGSGPSQGSIAESRR